MDKTKDTIYKIWNTIGGDNISTVNFLKKITTITRNYIFIIIHVFWV